MQPEGRWLKKTAPSPPNLSKAGVLGGRIIVVGGVNEMRTRLASVEALDPREGRWHSLAPLSAPRSSCGAAALQERLYVVG